MVSTPQGILSALKMLFRDRIQTLVQTRFHPFFSLPSVAKPNSDYFFLKIQFFSHSHDLLRGRFILFPKVSLQGIFSCNTGVQVRVRLYYFKWSFWQNKSNFNFLSISMKKELRDSEKSCKRQIYTLLNRCLFQVILPKSQEKKIGDPCFLCSFHFVPQEGTKFLKKEINTSVDLSKRMLPPLPNSLGYLQ
jgi:hypothetical protein